MRIKHLAAVTVGLTLVLAACSDDSDSVDTTPTTDELSAEMTEGDTIEGTVDEELSAELTEGERVEGTVDESDEELSAEITEGDRVEGTTDEAATTTAPASTTTEPPSDDALRIVSLSPTATEMVFAIGADDLLVAVDEFSDFPAEALELPNELSGFEPNVEAIAGFEPDLVLIGGDFTGLTDQLTPLGIDVLDLPAATTIDDTYAQIEQLGAVTGNVGEAAELVAQMQTDIDAIIEDAPPRDDALTYYHELSPDLFSATSTTFIGQVYSLLGLVNIADAAEGAASQFPQLNAEFLIESNPDLIFLADTKCCGETAETVAARDGWDQIAAVRDGHVFEMDDDIASRWGPRIVDYLQAVADAVASTLEPVAN